MSMEWPTLARWFAAVHKMQAETYIMLMGWLMLAMIVWVMLSLQIQIPQPVMSTAGTKVDNLSGMVTTVEA